MDEKLIPYIVIGLAGLSTGIGSLPILFSEDVSQKKLDVLLGAAAGIMLAATCFSLIVPSLEAGGGTIKGVLITSLGIFLGGVFLDLVDKYSPHEHLLDHRKEGLDNNNLKRIWLFVIAITIHNFPEGLATGVGFGAGNISDGITIATGIAIQNLPEGLAVALSLRGVGYSKKEAIIISALTGFVEPIAALLGLGLVSIFKPLLGFILAFAGGAMLFVISDEIIPETHRNGFEREATYGIMIGFIIMLILDVSLG